MPRCLLVLSCIVYLVPFSFLAPWSAHAAKQNESSPLVDAAVVVGLLQTAEETYPEELTFSYNITEMLTGLGARVVRIDYNALLAGFDTTKEALSWTPGERYEISNDEFRKIKNDVLDFIKRENISRIFIPGNFYNVDCEPYTPTPNRQLITDAITEIVHDNPSIGIMGICGGLQGIMNSLGVRVTRVKNLVDSHESVAAHAISLPDPHDKNVQLHRVRVVPGSNLAGVVSKYLKPDANGWFSIFFPDAHGGVVSNDPENMQKLESLGYKVVGFADDGVIEVLEDMHGNMLFQDHPEALAISFLKGEVLPVATHPCTDPAMCESCSKSQNLRYKAALSAMSIMEYFLHR
ncbi:hypothetical protein [Anaplasma bovis]|uniref:hypothetical protein n=1 Tax=Anaplasma bovis TaxID=186733 RepID=UPI002FF08871